MRTPLLSCSVIPTLAHWFVRYISEPLQIRRLSELQEDNPYSKTAVMVWIITLIGFHVFVRESIDKRSCYCDQYYTVTWKDRKYSINQQIRVMMTMMTFAKAEIDMRIVIPTMVYCCKQSSHRNRSDVLDSWIEKSFYRHLCFRTSLGYMHYTMVNLFCLSGL